MATRNVTIAITLPGTLTSTMSMTLSKLHLQTPRGGHGKPSIAGTHRGSKVKFRGMGGGKLR